MICGMLGRMFLVLAFILSAVGLMTGTLELGWLVLVTLGIGTLMVCKCHRAHWHDGWHAAHEHHGIAHPAKHLDEYQIKLARLS